MNDESPMSDDLIRRGMGHLKKAQPSPDFMRSLERKLGDEARQHRGRRRTIHPLILWAACLTLVVWGLSALFHGSREERPLDQNARVAPSNSEALEEDPLITEFNPVIAQDEDRPRKEPEPGNDTPDKTIKLTEDVLVTAEEVAVTDGKQAESGHDTPGKTNKMTEKIISATVLTEETETRSDPVPTVVTAVTEKRPIKTATILQPKIVTEMRPDPFDAESFKIIARGRIDSISEDGQMTIRVEQVLKGELKDKQDIRPPEKNGGCHTVLMSNRKWAWLKVCRTGDPVFLYWGHNPSVDLLVRGEATVPIAVTARTEPRKEDEVLRFHCGDWEFFRGTLQQYEKRLQK